MTEWDAPKRVYDLLRKIRTLITNNSAARLSSKICEWAANLATYWPWPHARQASPHLDLDLNERCRLGCTPGWFLSSDIAPRREWLISPWMVEGTSEMQTSVGDRPDVEHGGANVVVTEQPLYRGQVASGPGHLSRKCSPQRVRGNGLGDAG